MLFYNCNSQQCYIRLSSQGLLFLRHNLPIRRQCACTLHRTILIILLVFQRFLLHYRFYKTLFRRVLIVSSFTPFVYVLPCFVYNAIINAFRLLVKHFFKHFQNFFQTCSNPLKNQRLAATIGQGVFHL